MMISMSWPDLTITGRYEIFAELTAQFTVS